jgi:hypothetical protein
VFFWLVTDLTASPKHVWSSSSISSPSDSFITLAPETIARSSTVSSLVGPKPGASIIFNFILPFTWFANKADLGVSSTLPTINRDLFCFITYSNILCILLMFLIGEYAINIYGLSNSETSLSLSVIK